MSTDIPPTNELSENLHPRNLDGSLFAGSRSAQWNDPGPPDNRPGDVHDRAETARNPGPELREDLPARAITGAVRLIDAASIGGRRFALTTILIAIVTVQGLTLLAAAIWAQPAAWERLDGVAGLVLVPFQTLLGTAVGWHFAGRKSTAK